MKNLFDRILRAKIYQVAICSPLEKAKILSVKYANNISIKREDLQPIKSFKIRGAFNKINNLSEQNKKKGIITVSAGNHAQGVALSSKFLSIKAIIVMPVTTPQIKVDAVKYFGSEVILYGDDFDTAKSYAINLAKEKNLTLIEPFDDLDVIAGQGTIAVEIFSQYEQQIDAIFIPVGGGGLISGIATYIKKISPKTKIIGVEPEDSASMYKALKASKIICLKQVGIFTDGVAVKQVGKNNFKIAKELVDEVVLVNIDEICAAIKDIFEDNRSLAEPAGALAIAGLKKYTVENKIKNKNLIAIESGANINFDRLRHVSERADIGEKKEIVFATTIPEKPGSFRKFCKLLGKKNITEFNYRYANAEKAHIFVGMSTPIGDIFEKLEQNGIKVINLSDNEMALQHIRYMVGGKAPHITDEVIYRFEFPERPGALLDFLNKIGSKWNISLFHYRNHGSAFGRVLVGIQVPTQEIKILEQFFNGLNFQYTKEKNNPAYDLFL